MIVRVCCTIIGYNMPAVSSRATFAGNRMSSSSSVVARRFSSAGASSYNIQLIAVFSTRAKHQAYTQSGCIIIGDDTKRCWWTR